LEKESDLQCEMPKSVFLSRRSVQAIDGINIINITYIATYEYVDAIIDQITLKNDFSHQLE